MYFHFMEILQLSDSGSDCQCSGKVKLKPWHLTQLGKSHPYRDQRQRQSCLLFTIYLLAVLVSLHNKCFLWLKLQRVTIQTKHVRRDCGKIFQNTKTCCYIMFQNVFQTFRSPCHMWLIFEIPQSHPYQVSKSQTNPYAHDAASSTYCSLKVKAQKRGNIPRIFSKPIFKFHICQYDKLLYATFRC